MPNKRLADREFMAGADCSIADRASYPWIVPHARQCQTLNELPHLARRFAAIKACPATERACARAAEVNSAPTVSATSAALPFGQAAATIAKN